MDMSQGGHLQCNRTAIYDRIVLYHADTLLSLLSSARVFVLSVCVGVPIFVCVCVCVFLCV